MTFSYISHLYCSKGAHTFPHHVIQSVCNCGAPLLVAYDLNTLKDNWKRSQMKGRSNDLWRYHELLPVQRKEHLVSLGEGMTPLLHMESTSESYEISKLYMKDESMLPTVTVQALGVAVGVSKVNELQVEWMVMPTNGTAGAAWSLYAAKCC